MPQTIEIGKGIISIEVDTKKGTLSWQQMEEQAKESLQKIENKAKETAKESTNKFQEMGNKIKDIYQVVMASAAVGFAIKSISAIDSLIEKTREYGDEIAKTAKKMAISTTEFQQWQYVATLSGVSIDSLNTAIRRVSDLLDTARNGSEEAQKQFEKLGINIYNSSGNIKTASEIIYEVADRIRLMSNATDKVSTSVNLFGRSGSELLPILEQGSVGLRQMMEEANKLGLVIDENTLKAIERAKDESEILNKKLMALQITFGTQTSIKDYGNALKIYIYETIKQINKEIAALPVWASTSLKKVIDAFIATNPILKNYLSLFGFLQKVKEEALGGTKEVERKIKSPYEIARESSKNVTEEEKKIFEAIQKQLETFNNIYEKNKQITSELKNQKEILKDINKKNAIPEKTKNTLSEEEIVLPVSGINAIMSISESAQGMLPAINRWSQLNSIVEGTADNAKNLNAEMMSIADNQQGMLPVIKNWMELDNVINNATNNTKNWKDEMKEIADKLQEMSYALGDLGGAFAAMTEAGMINEKTNFKFQKTILILRMLMDAYAGLAESFKQGGWAGFALGLATFAKIMTYIAKIRSMEAPETPKVKYPKMAQGGIIMQRQIVEVAENNKPEAILPLDRLEQILNQQQEIKITLNVSDKASFLRGLTAEIEKIKRKEYV